MKKIALLGSTGSIGGSTLKVIRENCTKFSIVGLSAGTNVRLLLKQISEFRPRRVSVRDESAASFLKKHLRTRRTRVGWGEKGLREVATLPGADLVVVATSGTAALLPALSAIRQGKNLALANKETLVAAGRIFVSEAKRRRVDIIPIDSEHSAIFQCLRDENKKRIKKVILTASGGPFLNLNKGKFSSITPAQALLHPRWKMGKKITVDSATLMNKGLEAIEAHWLFGLPFDKIEVVIHPEAVIHSMVEFIDGSILAQASYTDMRLPIQYALSYPERFAATLPSLDFIKLKKLTFRKPDLKRFPSLRLAFRAGRAGGTMPAVLNAANEELVEAFLTSKIRFSDIPATIEKVMRRHRPAKNPGLGEILEADRWAREEARKCR